MGAVTAARLLTTTLPASVVLVKSMLPNLQLGFGIQSLTRKLELECFAD